MHGVFLSFILFHLLGFQLLMGSRGRVCCEILLQFQNKYVLTSLFVLFFHVSMIGLWDEACRSCSCCK